jgi:hypothetical protein
VPAAMSSGSRSSCDGELLLQDGIAIACVNIPCVLLRCCVLHG